MKHGIPIHAVKIKVILIDWVKIRVFCEDECTCNCASYNWYF